MFWNYLKSAFRYLVKNKFYAIVNILGLAVGLAVFILLVLYIQFELSFDNFHINNDRLYRVEQIMIEGGRTERMDGCPTPLWGALKKEFPEIEYSIRLFPNYGNLMNNTGQSFDVRGFMVDNAFLKMFSYEMIQGDPYAALREPFSIVVSESLAKTLFGDTDPMGKIVEDGDVNLKVTGVLKDPPKNTHLDFNVLFSVSTAESLWGADEFQRWGNNWVSCYIMLHPDHDIVEFDQKIKNILQKFHRENSKNELVTRPVDQIHLYSKISDDYAIRGSMENIYIISALALFILIMAGVNFTNLTIAYSTGRTREIGMRKVAGATQTGLFKQYMGESIMIVSIGLFLGFVLFETLLPRFNGIVNRELHFDYFNNLSLFLFVIGSALIVAFVSGIYPAILIARVRPYLIFQGNVSRGGKNPMLRKILVSIQFFMSVCFIVGAIAIMDQVNYMKHKDLGYDPENVVTIPFEDTTMNRINFYRVQILSNPDVINASVHDYQLFNSTNWTRVSWEGADEEEYLRMSDNYSDHHLVNTYNMKLISGEGFVRAQKGTTAEGNEVILNEAAIRVMGIQDPVGKKILYGGDYRGGVSGNSARIVGVLKDFHFLSAHNEITPMMIRLLNEEQTGWRISVRINQYESSETLKFLEDHYKIVFPEQNFTYEFVNNDIANLYAEEKKLGEVILNLSVLAIFIACLGTFGLISFTTSSRTKEVGIRKVMGSRSGVLYSLFAKEYILLILISSVIAYPISYMVINHWLDNFPYRVSMNVVPFIVATVVVILFTLFSMSFSVMKVIRRNPVDALRYE